MKMRPSYFFFGDGTESLEAVFTGSLIFPDHPVHISDVQNECVTDGRTDRRTFERTYPHIRDARVHLKREVDKLADKWTEVWKVRYTNSHKGRQIVRQADKQSD